MTETKTSALAASGRAFEDQLREAVILATLVRHPSLVERYVSDLERLDTTTPEHTTVRNALLTVDPPNEENLTNNCDPRALEKVFAPRHVHIAPGVRPGSTLEQAEMSVAEAFAKLAAKRGAEHEIAEAAEDLVGLADEGLTWRLGQAAEALHGPGDESDDDKAVYDVGPNGARVKRDEKQRFEALLSRIDPSKGRRTEP